MNPIGAYCPGYSQYASVETDKYPSSASVTTELFSSYLKLIPNLSICIEGSPLIITMNVLVFRPLLAGWTPILFIYFIFYSRDEFLIKISLRFPWLLFSVGGLGGTWNLFYIKKYLMSEINVLKKATAMTKRNIVSCVSLSILKRNRV